MSRQGAPGQGSRRAGLRRAAAVAGCALVLGACGGGGGSADPTTTAVPTTVRAAATTVAPAARTSSPPTSASPTTTLAPTTTAVPTTVAETTTTLETTTTVEVATTVEVPTTVAPPPTAPPAPPPPPPAVPSETLPRPVSPPPPRAIEAHVEVGTIEIPKIGISKKMLEGISLNTLDKGPGHWPGTAMPGQLGNVVVAGHRTSKDRPFRHIDQLVTGDEVIFTTADGRFVYTVIGTEIVLPNAMWIVGQTAEATATLFACHPVGSTRERIVVFLQLQA